MTEKIYRGYPREQLGAPYAYSPSPGPEAAPRVDPYRPRTPLWRFLQAHLGLTATSEAAEWRLKTIT